ncbi:MAG: hypothetical protein GYB64_03930, partial [Chloroflexi bacterium]|nr:hypothetical protein [Chloroflexota bacterium]
MRPVWICFFVVAMLSACSPFNANVTTTGCPVDLPEGASGVTCGTIRVPEDHADPGGPQIELAFALLAARDLVKQPDPIVMVEGGPGGSAMENLLPVFASPDADFFRAKRDLIIIE